MGLYTKDLLDWEEGAKLSIKDYLTKKYPGDDNRYFVSRMLEYLDRCDNTQQRIFTDFLDPIKVKIVLEISKSNADISIGLYGVFEEAERQMAAVFPEWDRVEPREYPIVIFRITDKGWGKTLNHRDYLGALLGIGIKREKVGDLVVRDGSCLAAVHQDIAGFIETTLERTGRSKVKIERIDTADLELKPEFKEKRITVASPRLDGIVGEALNLSRAKSAGLINTEKVKVNWEVCTRTDITLQEGDIISVRGEGKFKVQELAGVTKKGRSVMIVKKYI